MTKNAHIQPLYHGPALQLQIVWGSALHNIEAKPQGVGSGFGSLTAYSGHHAIAAGNKRGRKHINLTRLSRSPRRIN